MSERAQDRLSRLLGLVPYLTRRPGTDLDEVAAHFGVPRAQIVDDLELLFVTGRPGHMPDDLIEAEWGSGAVFVGNADEVSVPVRLSAHEAGGLLLALDYLDSARQAEPEVLASVRAKLATAAGEVPGTAVDAAPPRIPAELAATVRAAIETGETLDIDYYVPARDELTRRTIRPLRLRLGRVWYLDAHCLTAGGDRSFAVDRIRTATPAAASVRTDGATAPAGNGASAASAQEDTGLDLVLSPEAAWLADELDPAAQGGTRVDDARGPGSVAVSLPRAGRAWAVRLLTAHGAGVREARPESVVSSALQATRAALALYDRADPPAQEEHGAKD
jgi:proteasome accessory factor C